MRRPLPAVCFVLGVLALLPSRSAAGPHDHRHDDPALRAIEAAQRAGALDADEALMLSMQRIFEPESLPDAYRTDALPLLRCATPIVQAAQTADLSDEDRARVDAWLSPELSALARRAAYTTPEGHFDLDFVVTGANAVPLDDVDPANGVPDYVERIGHYFEESWQREFDDLGFVAPDVSGGRYRVLLRRIGAYGYTALTDEGSAGTEITVHHTFLNFPANEDPEGNQWGAAKVTAAHELKHASQWANNGWTEPGLWIEIDATWTEDVVYDQVNDFYNYITFRSPITDPTRPLDDGGSGAYAEAIWQHWMSESWGIEAIVDFWERRAAAPQEDVMTSYAAIIAQNDRPLVDAWADFAAWNYATGTSSIPGYGYEESLAFPTAPLTAEAATLPASFSGSVERLAANFVRVTGFSNAEEGVVTITPQLPPASPLRARVAVVTRNGQRSVEEIVFENGVATELSTPLTEVAEIVVIVGHGDLQQGAAVYQFDVAAEIRRPTAVPQFGGDAVRSRVLAGRSSSRSIELENVGAENSVLDYEALVIAEIPAARGASIGGSDLTVADAAYVPATTTTLQIDLTNRSVDFEWIQGVSIDFPEGVTVVGAADFLAPGSRRLVSDGATGDGARVTWTDPDGAWGNVQNGEIATAAVEVAFAAALHGDLVVPYTLEGDGFGAGSSTVEGALLLVGPASPLIAVDPLGPLLRVGSTTTIGWTAEIEGDVRIDLSRDGGASWSTLVASTANDGRHDWKVTGPTSFDARFRVLNAADPVEFGESAARVSIGEAVSWAQVPDATGSLPRGESTTLDVVFDASALDAGTYTAQLALVYEGMVAPAFVPVELIVSSDGTSTVPNTRRGVVHGARPNPFNPTTHVELTLSRRSTVRVDVYDTAGRHVRTLHDGSLDAGDHRVRWDGIDASGRRVASGVYLYAVDLQGERFVGKVGLVK